MTSRNKDQESGKKASTPKAGTKKRREVEAAEHKKAEEKNPLDVLPEEPVETVAEEQEVKEIETHTRPKVIEPELPVDEEQRIENLFAMIQDLQSELESSYTIKECLEQDLTKANDELAELRNRARQQEKYIRDLEGKIPDIDTLREELDFAEQEKSEAQARLAALEQKRENLEKERASLAASLEKTASQLKETKAANVKLGYQVMRLEECSADLDILRKEHEKLKEMHDEAERQVANLQSELEVAETAQTELGEGLKTSKRVISKLEADYAEQKHQRARLEQDNRELKTQLSSLTEQNAGMATKIQSLEKELEKEKKDAERREAEQRKTFDEIHTALSKTRRLYYQKARHVLGPIEIKGMPNRDKKK